LLVPVNFIEIGESAGAECKATLQETTQLVEERLASNKQAVKALFDAAEVYCIYPYNNSLCENLEQ
jgi:hypothetical protein